MKKHIAITLLTLASGLAMAQATPVGLWKTIDDDTKEAKSLVRITEANGIYSGKVEKIFDASKQDSKCEKCSDDRKDKPVLGMVILRDIKKGGEEGVFDGGSIIDPNNGKTYKARLKPVENGQKLEMRGYIGPFFRTQVWLKAE